MPRLDLQALAARVSDGEVVDWDEIERSGPSGHERRVIRNLRLVASLASASSEVDVADDVTASMTTTLMESIAATPAPATADGPTRWGGLEIRESIGAGAFGEVFRAHDRNLDRDVALKLLRRDDDRASRVLEEGRALARVRHPNVVTVHGAERHDDRVGLWMELVRGRSLEQTLEEQGPFGGREAALLGLDLARALAAVHAAGLIHRDVKAQNAMREQGGRVVLMDFGAVFDRDSLAAADRSTISGTPLYIAPEVFDGDAPDVGSDIYALGVLLYHLVTGSYPVQAHSVDELRRRHADGRMALLRDVRPDLPDDFVRVVQRAIDRDPSRRFATAGEMEQALAGCLGLDAPAPTSAPADRPSRPWLLFAIGAAALAALVIALAWPRGDGGVAEGDEPALRREEPAAPPPGPEPRERIADADTPPPTGSGTVAGSDVPDAARTTAEPEPVPVVTRDADPVAGPEYTIAASLYRRDSTNRQDRLESGARLDPDDRLWLEMTVSREVWVYVINRDDKGNGYALFPLPTLDQQNPLPAGERVRIPGEIDGRAQYWGVSVAGGREELMILASPERQVQFEAEMAGLQQPTPLAVEVEDFGDLPVRGIGAIVPGRTGSDPAESAARLFDMADVLVGTGVESVNGVWFRKVHLVNPESW